MSGDIGQDPHIFAEFARRKTIQRTLMYLAYLPVIFAIYVRWNPDFTLGGLTWGPLFGMGLGLGIVLMVASYMVWRCPACNRFIGFNRRATSCSHCKTRFIKTR